jgi:hypothetical protein
MEEVESTKDKERLLGGEDEVGSKQAKETEQRGRERKAQE